MGITARETEELNRRIDAATDLPALEEEIPQIRARLTNRRGVQACPNATSPRHGTMLGTK